MADRPFQGSRVAELILRGQQRRALERVAYRVLGEAQRQAPKEEGTLEASAEVTMHDTPDGPVAVLSFSTVYARRQHEETTWEHADGRKAKYLEDPVKACDLAAELAREVRL